MWLVQNLLALILGRHATGKVTDTFLTLLLVQCKRTRQGVLVPGMVHSPPVLKPYCFLCFFPGGPLTVTDANLALGRLLPSFFPKIFGPGENEPLSLDETMKHFHQLTQDINLFLSSKQSQALDFLLYFSSAQTHKRL